MKTALRIALCCFGLLAGLSAAPARALPRGCVSASSEYSVGADTFSRSLQLLVNQDKACTFTYAAGDTYSGTGRFEIWCSGGGHFFHPDYRDDREIQPDVNQPIPQPCKPGDTVTLDGFHPFTGGLVAAGGADITEAGTKALLSRVVGSPPPQRDFEDLCKPGSAATASVSLQEPVNYNGVLTFGGSVACIGATVEITSVSLTGFGGSPPAVYAGKAKCKNCSGPVSVSAKVPSRTTQWDVDMDFTVVKGNKRVTAHRLGRYFVSWAGHVTTLYPMPSDDLQ